MPIPKTVAEFADLWTRSELIGKADLDKYFDKLGARGDAPADATALGELAVKDGLLTKFQFRLLIQGRHKNFFLGGKYKVLEHLGTGGMGAVYLCEHRHMRRRVAVKLLPPDKNDPDRIPRFQREAQAIAMMNHPNIVRAFDVDREGAVHFLVMEFIDGISLQQLVDRRGPLGIARTVNYVSQVACGLQHAGEMGLVHRDIKPSNLMIDTLGAIKILDLGLARFATLSLDTPSQKDSQIVLGTADYLAPEQARTSTVDIRADIYGLGAVAYFMLTGHPPFDGGNVAQKLMRHQSEVPRLLSEEDPKIPVELATVIARMLAKSPADRPLTPARVVDELQPWLMDVDPPTIEEMPPERFWSHRDIDTKAKLSTSAMISKSSRALILKTMLATPAQQ
ncbi:serine/threonine-protein kinase [Zavarzinella formosa]|uniref:serine/threonine-protein kinase n=1 Tax=Zavarzinella formosa TaxID=360055 RepID=UPI0012F7347C|nr:serine/threonine-protein kinase [Zavarzinella formosa]